MLEVSQVSKSFISGFFSRRKKVVVTNISFTLEEGEMIGITGESGSGKSTLIRMIMGLLSPDEGTIRFCGRTWDSLDREERKKQRAKMQLLFQNPSSALNPHMRIKESLEEPLHIHDLPMKHIEETVARMQVRPEVLERYPHQVSGGELQRICLARLLLMRPSLLLLDEPTSMLDVSVQAQIVEILKEERETRGMSSIFISHDMDLLRNSCQRIGVLHQGRLLEIQETERLYAQPQMEYTKALIKTFDEF